MRNSVLLLMLFIPMMAWANIANEINTFIDRFFQTPSSSQEINTSNVSEVIGDFQFDDERSQQYAEDRITYLLQELEVFESSIREKEQSLWSQDQKKRTIRENINLLDQQLNIQNQKLQQIQAQKKKWNDELQRIASQKSSIVLQKEAYKKDIEKQAIRRKLRENFLGNSPEIQKMRWLFSSQKVSDLLASRRKEREAEQRKKQRLASLYTSQNFIENQERHAFLVQRTIQDLEAKTIREKNVYENLLQAKASLEQQLQSDTQNTNQELESIYTARSQLIQDLQTMQSVLHTEEGLPQTEPISPDVQFSTPLSIPLQITASFEDPQYEKTFGIPHDGVDFFAPPQTPILAVADGIVQKVDFEEYDYASLILFHPDLNLYTIYGHISQALASEGDLISVGDTIALSGGVPGEKGSGFLTTGPHLHFSVFKNGVFVDPMQYLSIE